MLKKGMALLALLGLAGLANLFFAYPTQAIEPSANGCFMFKDQPPICPDKYCQPGTASCSNDGKRCYCKPRFLVGSSRNQSCEIVFGSKAIYKTTGGKNTIYFHGGIWSQIANSIKNSPWVEVVDGEPAIKFEYVNGDTYKSGFLNNLASLVPLNKGQYDFQYTVNMLISARIDSISGTGEVYNQRYEMERYGQVNPICGHLQYGNNPFFLKYSSFSDDPFDPKRSPCIMPSAIMTLFIFGRNNQSILSTGATVPMTKNCTDQKWEHDAGLLEKFIKSIFTKENIDLHLTMANLTVPHGQVRKLYMAKEDNFFFGEIIDGTNTTEKLQRIADRCKRECRSTRPPRDCQFCNSPLTQAIRSNPTKTLNDIIIDGLIKKDKAICSLVDTSMDYISGISSSTPRRSVWEEAIDGILPKKDLSDQEAKLNKQIPSGLKRLCDSKSLTEKQRVLCKTNALDCYLNNLPEEEPADMCSQLTGELESSRWMICPASNTLSAAADRSVSHIQEFFQLNSSSIFNNPIFQKAWSFFRNASNIFLVIIVMWVIVSQITNFGLSNYNLKKMMPRLIVAIFLINLSFIIAQIAVDLSNLAGSGFFYLFDNLANQIKLSGSVDISVSSIAFGVLTGAGALAILGGLVLLLPALVILLIGLVFIVLLLSMRHGLVVIFVLLMPFAILANVIPRFEGVFRSWSKNFFNVIMLYPVIGFLYGGGRFLKLLLVSVSEGDNLIQLIGFALPVLTTLATPLVLMNITKGILALNNFMEKQYSSAKNAGFQAAQQSGFNQAIKANQDNLKLKLANSKFARGVYKSPIFNRTFTGAGYDLIKRNQARQSQSFNTFQGIVNHDGELLQAFHEDQGSLTGASYKNLSTAQQEKYRQLVNVGALNDAEFYTVSLNTLAGYGGLKADGSQIGNIIANAQSHNLTNESISDKLFVASKIAEKAGNPVTSGLLNYASKQVTTTPEPNTSQPKLDHKNAIIDYNDSEEVKKLQGSIDTAFNKIRPGNLKTEDFKVEAVPKTGNQPAIPNLAIQTIRDKIRQNTNLDNLSNHYIGAIGQDYHMMPEMIKQEIEHDVIDIMQKHQHNIKAYTSAESALRSENLLKNQIGGGK